MSTQALIGLRDFLVESLSVADMNWLAAELKEFIEKNGAPRATKPSNTEGIE